MSEPKETAAPAAKKLVKIKILRDCAVGTIFNEDGSIKVAGQVKLPGTICEVTEKEAAELCDTYYHGYHPFYGTMPEIGPLLGDVPNPLVRKKIARAARVA